jgi:hypothetical protein
MIERDMTRVQRMANGIPAGPAILRFLCSTDGRQRLTEAAARGTPPVAGISRRLLEAVGTDALKSTVAKQFVGLVARAVLAQAGYVPIRSGVRVRHDPVFTAGAAYAKRFAAQPQSDDGLLKRLLDGLTSDEMRWALVYLRQRLEDETEQNPPETGA